jgi:hypothetical protein
LEKDDLILLYAKNKNIILNKIQLFKSIPPSTETEEIKVRNKGMNVFELIEYFIFLDYFATCSIRLTPKICFFLLDFNQKRTE